MFKCMSSNRRVINLSSKITTQVSYKLDPILTGRESTEMSSLFDDRTASHILIPPKHLIDLCIRSNISPHNTHNSQILPRNNLLPKINGLFRNLRGTSSGRISSI